MKKKFILYLSSIALLIGILFICKFHVTNMLITPKNEATNASKVLILLTIYCLTEAKIGYIF